MNIINMIRCTFFAPNRRIVTLAHPEKPGVYIVCYRNLIQRFFYPKDRATIGETMIFYRYMSVVNSLIEMGYGE